MADLIISVSGLRGIVGRTLTPEVAIRYAAAFSATSPSGAFVITRDGRRSGEMLAQLIHAGLHALGRNTVDGSIAATPTTGILIRRLAAAGGIQVSASHNPSEYNGMKLFGPEGRVIPSGPGQNVLDRYRGIPPTWALHDRLGTVTDCPDPHAVHLEAVLATVNVQKIRAAGYKVLLDSNRGAGSLLGRRLLDQLGCRTTILGDRPDGRFEHTPEPTADNLADVLHSVREAGADVGFCQDPDADRLAVIDANGRYLGEEYTLAMCVDHVLRHRKGPIAANCSTSRMSEDLALKYGVTFHRSAVGEANVIDSMLAHDAIFGGEGNGGPIDPAVGPVRDSFVAMAQLLDAMADRELSIGELADELPRYEIVKTKISLDSQRVPAGLDALARHFDDARPDRLDGLRLDWPDRWLLVRASNTEPIGRAVAEAKSREVAKRLCEEAGEGLKG